MNPEWTDFEKYVVSQLIVFSQDISKMREEIAGLKAHAAVWGAIAGGLAVAISEFFVKSVLK